jgi:hypothetical protein
MTVAPEVCNPRLLGAVVVQGKEVDIPSKKGTLRWQ